MAPKVPPADSPEGLVEAVRVATTDAVRAELGAGLGVIRQIVREELDREEDSDEDGEDDDDDDEDETPTCPKGHALKDFVTDKEYVCDLCRKSFTTGTTLYGCRKCDYDVCRKCLPKACSGGVEEYKLTICVRHDLGMTAGKIAAQVGHAVHHAITEAKWRDFQAWDSIGAKKVSLKVDSEEELREIKKEARKRGINANDIQDAGHTEVAPGTTTVLAVGPARARDVDAVTGHLKPLPDRVQQLERENKKLRDRAERLQQELDASKKKQKALLAMLRQQRAPGGYI